MSVFDFIIRFKSDGVDQMANTVKGKLGRAMGDLRTAAAGYLSVQYAKQQVEATAEYALKIKDLGEQFAISTDKLQEMEYAAKMSGMSIEDIITAYSRFKLAREAALTGKRGNGDQKNFDMLGISSGQLSSMSPEAAWDATGKAISKVKESADTARLSVDLFGRGGMRITNALKGGFMDAAASAKGLGIVISEDLITKIDILDKKMSLFKLRFRRGTATVVGGGMSAWDSMLPGASGVAGAFNAFLGTALRPSRWGSMFDNIAQGYHGTKNQAEIDQMNLELEIARMDAHEKRQKNSNQSNLTSTTTSSSGPSASQADALARIGLYRGGAGPSQSSLLQTQIRRLDQVVRELKAVNGNLTEE